MSDALLQNPHAIGNANPRYINRELSWLRFNWRVLREAENKRHPLLERLKYLGIFESNLDEFFMVRVSGLFEQVASGMRELTPDGLTAQQQLEMIAETALPMRRFAAAIWETQIAPGLEKAGIRIRGVGELTEEQQNQLETYFRTSVFPLCTPLILYPNPTFPHLSNRSLNLAVVLEDEGGERLARVKVPPVVPRLVRVKGQRFTFVLLEDLLKEHLDLLFPGVKVKGAYLFRVLRDADIEIRELEAADLISMVEQTLRLRRFGDPVLLEVDAGMPDRWVSVLRKGLELDEHDVMPVDGMIGMELAWELFALDKPNLKHKMHAPVVDPRLGTADDIFRLVSRRDVLLHHPYDSFRSVETFIAGAARDPKVVGVKQTLYRVGSSSPIVESLLEAAEKGRQVAAMVELKARFDESNNLVWSKALEHAGVHVSYGFKDKKVHCKLCLIVRNEKNGIKTYVHVGTGNYNPSTARVYTDLGLITSDPDVCQDVAELFNDLTGYSRQTEYRKLLVAPYGVREGILERIEREAEIARKTGKGEIAFKLNSLVDPEVIDALYEASQAGVAVDLVVRGICCLRAGVKGLSERIRVVSVIGRFLEHSRVYYFGNGGEPEAFIGSADMMRRNLDRRVEVLVPVPDRGQVSYLRDEVIGKCFLDNQQAWRMLATGVYGRVKAKKGQEPFSVQDYLMTRPASEVQG